jgi:hypothetical protein
LGCSRKNVAGSQRFCFGGFRAWSASVLVYELDAGGFKGVPNDLQVARRPATLTVWGNCRRAPLSCVGIHL